MFGDWIKKGISGLSGLFGGGNNNNQQAQADAQRQADLAAQRQREEAERKRREEEERKRREEAAAEAKRRAEEQARVRQQQEAARRQQEQANPLRVPTTPTSLNVNQTINRNTAQANRFGNINSETNQRELDLRARSDELYKNTLANEHKQAGVLERLFGQKDINERAYNQARSQAIREQAENLNYQDADTTNRLFKGVQDQYSQANRRINDSKERQQIWQNSLGTAIDTYKDTVDRAGRGAGDIIFGQDDNPDQIGLKDVGRFIVNLPGGMAGAPLSATTKIAESFLDKDYNFNAETGDYDSRDLTAIQRAAKLADAGIDIYGLQYGGSGAALNSLTLGGKQALKQSFKQGLKDIGVDMLQEGGEELAQSLLGDLGDNGGFDDGTLSRAITSGLLGGAGGGVMSGFGSGVSRLRGGNQDVRTDTGRPGEFMTQGAVEVNPQTDINDSAVEAPMGMPMSVDLLDSLKAEARKHKTAEEFVNSQPKHYRGAVDMIEGAKRRQGQSEIGIAFSSSPKVAKDFAIMNGGRVGERYISPTAKVLQYKDIPTELLSNPGMKERNIVAYARNNGFDAVDLSRFPGAKGEAETRVVNENVIRTKEQLTDLYNQAHSEGARTGINDSPDVSKIAENNQTVANMINEADNIQTSDPISELGAEQPTPVIHTASPSPETGGIYGDTQQSPNISETLNETIGSATTDNTGIAAQRLQQVIKGSVNQDIKKQSYNAGEIAQAVNQFYDSTTPMEAASALAGLEINGANDILAANELIQRLEKDNMTLKDPAIREAMLAAGDRISKKSSNAGSDLRATAEFHQNLPTELWIENVKRDLAKNGQALTPEQEANLKSKKDALKSAAQEVKTIYRSASKLADEMGKLIRSGKMTEDMATEYDTVGKQLADAQQAADRDLKIANDSLRKDLRKTSKNGAFRKSVDTLSNGYRTLLLSSGSGRLADLGSTLLKSVDKLAASTVSNTIGKVANKINPEAGLRQGAGAGTTEAFARGAKRGGQRLKDIITNQQNPDARMGETIGGAPGRLIRAMTETAPALTEGAIDVRLLNTVRGELKAEFPNATDRQLDSMARIAAVAERGDPTSGAFNEATRYHNEINMTGTDNVISQNVDKVINKMEKQPALKAVATLTAPFARFSANSAYNIARRNPIGDLVALGKNVKDGNTQGIVDNLGELTVDTAKMAAYAAARGAGGLEDEDNDGQTYESNYIKWNDNATSPLDRIAVSDNTNATLGKSISDLQNGSDLKDVVGNALGETVNDIPGRVFDNMTNNSVARALGKLTDYRNSGGENLENAAEELSKLFNPAYNPNDTMKFGDSNISVPFASSPLGRDIRTGIDSKQSFGDRVIQNPARSEATQNRRDNEKSAASLKTGDWFSVNASETKKDNGQTINKQTIARNDGKDPSFKGDISNLQSHMKNSGYSDDQVNDAINMLSMTKNEVLRDFETNGSQNAVRRHANAYLEALRASDANTTEVRKAERFLKLAEVNEKYDVPVELQQAYNKTDLSTWRAMEDDNPELFNLLYQYGQALADAGISKKSTESGIDSASESNTNKYYAKKSGKGGGSGRSGGSGKGISTSVGTIKVENNNTGVKSRSITTPKSHIPGLQKLNSTPKLKKISVKDGFKY